MAKQLSTNDLAVAAAILRGGGLVAFPTETVFGLGADATSPDAISRIFKAKGRPSDNPLIVHLAEFDQLNEVCEGVTPIAEKLLQRFAPGPLTVVLPKKPCICSAATANLSSVAVRFPSHPTARSLLKQVALPIAAPSANRSGSPSATTWQSVLRDLDGRIDAIVCDEACALGLESTVVDCTDNDTPILLRSGHVTLEDLQTVVPNIRTLGSLTSVAMANSPGLRHRHYQPRARVRLCESMVELADDEKPRSAYIGLGSDSLTELGLVQLCTSVEDYAMNLYEFFRRCDASGMEIIWCQRVPERGVGLALMDRLYRASDRSG